jgi:hypothetical protein
VKTIFTIFFGIQPLIGLFSQQIDFNQVSAKRQNTATYYTWSSEHKRIVSNTGTSLDKDLFFENGRRLTPKGLLILESGTRLKLRHGECVDNTGKIMDRLIGKHPYPGGKEINIMYFLARIYFNLS